MKYFWYASSHWLERSFLRECRRFELFFEPAVFEWNVESPDQEAHPDELAITRRTCRHQLIDMDPQITYRISWYERKKPNIGWIDIICPLHSMVHKRVHAGMISIQVQPRASWVIGLQTNPMLPANIKLGTRKLHRRWVANSCFCSTKHTCVSYKVQVAVPSNQQRSVWTLGSHIIFCHITLALATIICVWMPWWACLVQPFSKFLNCNLVCVWGTAPPLKGTCNTIIVLCHYFTLAGNVRTWSDIGSEKCSFSPLYLHFRECSLSVHYAAGHLVWFCASIFCSRLVCVHERWRISTRAIALWWEKSCHFF